MAKRRTKKDKKQALIRRQEGLTYTLPALDTKEEEVEVKTKKNRFRPRVDESGAELLAYDVGLLKKDLWKTVGLSLLVFGVEMGLFIYLS